MKDRRRMRGGGLAAELEEDTGDANRISSSCVGRWYGCVSSLGRVERRIPVIGALVDTYASCVYGSGGELRADAESGVGVDPEAHAHSAVKYDSEASWVVRLESGSESELRKSDSVRARKRAR